MNSVRFRNRLHGAFLPKKITYVCKNPSSHVEQATRRRISEISQYLCTHGLEDAPNFGEILYSWFKLDLFKQGKKKVGRQVGLIAGPTGCGKSESIARMCQSLKLAYHRIDLSNCVEEGIVGQSINDHITDIYLACKKSGVEWETPRLVALEEAHVALMNVTHYANGLQRQILPLLGGESITATRGYRAGHKPPRISTKNVSVHLVGSFDGTLTRRTHSLFGNSTDPFGLWNNCPDDTSGDELSGLSSQELNETLEGGGVAGELLGRLTLPSVVMRKPAKTDFERVLRLNNHLNPMPQLLALLVQRTITLSSRTVERIITDSARRNLGYRSLRQVCEEVIYESLPALLNGASTI